jgi:hypothetical protein
MRWKWNGQPPGVTASVSSRFYLHTFFSLCRLVGGSPAPGDLRTAHLRRAEEKGGLSFFCLRCFRHISLWDDAFVLLRD